MRRLIYLFLGIFIFLQISGTLGCSGSKAQMKNDPSGNVQKQQANPPKKEAPAAPAQKEVLPSPEGTEGGRPQSLAQVTPPPIPAKPEPPTPPTPPPPPVPPGPPRPGVPTAPPSPAPTVSPTVPSPAPSFPAPPTRPAEPRAGQGVVFNFDNADLYEVIRIMAEIMKINYIIDPKVRGVVNIHTSGQIAMEEVFSIFQTILKLNGATTVKKDNLYEIVPFGDAKKLTPPVSKDPGKTPLEMRYVIQIIPLKYIPVAEASKLLKPFLSDGADIVEHPSHNILILGDVSPNIRKCLDIIGLFDIDIFTDMRVRIYPVLNADVTEVAKEMERIFSSFEVSTKSGRGVGITFTPVTRINSLLVVSSIPNIFEKVEGWLKELDKVPAEGTKISVFVYYCQNSKAKDLADVLKQIFVAGKEKKAEFKEKVVTPEATPRAVRPSPTPAPATPAKEEAAAVPEGELNIVVDEANNALVIRAFARDYRSILETIKKLDIYPKQVLIEVLLAEITLGDTYRFGVEWSRFLTSPPTEAQEIIMGATPPADPFNLALGTSAIRYAIVEAGGKFSAAISAAARDNRLNVISSPHILASNNKEAKIQVGSSQPILTSTYTTTATGTPGVVEGTIEYKDIGIILTVTPRVSDGGLVSLELSIEDSTVNEQANPLGNLENVPVFGKRTAKTILSIQEGQTIVIGGLIQDSKDTVKSGVPLLSKIPVIGALFGTQTYIKRKTELLILMTPHVIADIQQSNAVTKEFREKVEGLKLELQKKEEKEKKKKK